MPIGDITSKISEADRERMRQRRNPPDYQEGFEPGAGGGDDWDDLESMLGGGGDSLPGLGDDFGGDLGPDIGGGGPPPMRSLGMPGANDPFGGPNQFGGQGQFGQSMYGQQFGQPQGAQEQQVQPQPDAIDKAFDLAAAGGGATLKVLGTAVKTMSTRNYDEWARYGLNLIYAGGVSGVLAIISLIVWVASEFKMFSPTHMTGTLFLTGITSAIIGAIGIMVCAILIAQSADKYNLDASEIPEFEPEGSGVTNFDMESSLGGMFGDYGDDGDDDLGDLLGFEDDGDDEDEYSEPEPSDSREDFYQQFETSEEPEETVDFSGKFSEVLQTIGKKPILNRDVLFNTFKPLFPTNTTDFDFRREVSQDSDEYVAFETLCMKALAAALGKPDFVEVPSSLEKLVETKYTYEFRMKRVPGLTKLDAISRELVAYLKSSVSDSEVSCTTDIDGDLYVSRVTKGVSAVVTFGDLFKRPDACEFFLNTKNLLPMCVGIKMDGQPVLVDAKLFDTMLIAGRPRSGKSWYVLSFIMSMVAFNTPETVQFLIVDPKKSNLMNTLHLLPHVCGVVDDSDILSVLDGVIHGEAERRKKLLADNHCDKLFDLWEIGIQVPVLYIVIDEYMTVLANLNDGSVPDFQSKIKVIISQLPSLGIRLLIVPHRAKGVVDVTARTNISFSAAVRAENQVITETLDIKKWDVPLLNPGDTAVKMQGMGDPIMVSGMAITTSDMENAKFIENMAKLYYQMGVDIPDMRAIGPGYTRNDDGILEELKAGRDSRRVQQDIDALPDGEEF